MQTQEEAKQRRSWRDAKIPQWVRESVEVELAAGALAGALAWPTEKKPEPMPFWWGDYDHQNGVAETGRFWTVHVYSDNTARLECFEIERFDKARWVKSWRGVFTPESLAEPASASS